MIRNCTNDTPGSELFLNKLSLGTAPLGGLFRSVSEAESDAMIDLAISSGINYIDTAPLYGYGTAERRVGRATRFTKNNVGGRNHPRCAFIGRARCAGAVV